MSSNNNKKNGNKFEVEFCELLFENGYWAHNLTQNSAGQPADVIAVKKKKSYLIDCKVVSFNTRGFALSRVEDNQHLAMQLWKERTGQDAWFAIKYEIVNKIYMFSYETIKKLDMCQSTINQIDAMVYGTEFEEWINGSTNRKYSYRN